MTSLITTIDAFIYGGWGAEKMMANANRRGENTRQDINIGVKLTSLRFDTSSLSPHENSFIHMLGFILLRQCRFTWYLPAPYDKYGLFTLFYESYKIKHYEVNFYLGIS